jgi:hypothetical protein
MLITRPLDTAHFPAPVKCPLCGHIAAFTIADSFMACTSQECDPSATTWSLLDALFRVLAGQAQR